MILAVMTATTINASAQHEEGETTLQPRAGVTFSNITDGDKTKVNFSYGVEVEHFLTDQFSVAGGVLFSNQGCKYDEYVDDETHQTLLGSTTLNIYYGALPFTANYYVLPGLAIKAGVQPAMRVKANIEYEGQKVDFDRAVDALFEGEGNKMNKFDLSIPVGLSYEYSGVTLDARYNIGVTNLITEGDTHIHQKVFVVTLGYKF